MGKRDEDIHSLAEDFVPFVLRHEFYGPAVVQAVRKFDEHHSDIIVQSEKDTFEILCLKALGLNVRHFCTVLVVEHRLDFGKTVHQGSNLVAEQGTDIVNRIFRIFYNIVEQGGSH